MCSSDLVPLRDIPVERLGGEVEDLITHSYAEYLKTARDDVRVLLGRFRHVDAAQKVVGVGSVGTRCAILLLQGADERDLLFLQIKEARASVLERYLAPSTYAHPGHRVVNGQRLMQGASDPFLGWGDGPLGRHFYWRDRKSTRLNSSH